MYVCEDMLGCVHVKGCPYFSPPCQHSGLTESWKWKDRAILLAVCLARFPLSLCHSGSASESLTEMLWRLLCHISSAAGRLTDGQDRQEVRAGWQVGSNEAQIPCVYLPLCALESTGQEGKKKSGWQCDGAWVWMHVRVEEKDAFSYSCLSASMACGSEASCCLDHAGASTSVSKRRNGNLCDMARVWVGVVIQALTLLMN